MGQTEEIRMTSRGTRFPYTPITRGHKPSASQESNTLSTMSEVSCVTTVSSEAEAREERMGDFREEEERGVAFYRSSSEETVDTVVAVTTASLGPGGSRSDGYSWNILVHSVSW